MCCWAETWVKFSKVECDVHTISEWCSKDTLIYKSRNLSRLETISFRITRITNLAFRVNVAQKLLVQLSRVVYVNFVLFELEIRKARANKVSKWNTEANLQRTDGENIVIQLERLLHVSSCQMRANLSSLGCHCKSSWENALPESPKF